MHGQNVEFGNLIPGKFGFWKEIFAILRGNLDGYFCRFLTKISENLYKKKSYFVLKFFAFLPALVLTNAYPCAENEIAQRYCKS